MDSVMAIWVKQCGSEAEVSGWLGGRRFNDGFSAWSDKHGSPAPDFTEEEISKVKLPHTPLVVDYLWSPTNERQNEGVFVARVFNDKLGVEIKGSRFYHKSLDCAVAASAKFIKRKHYK